MKVTGEETWSYKKQKPLTVFTRTVILLMTFNLEKKRGDHDRKSHYPENYTPQYVALAASANQR